MGSVDYFLGGQSKQVSVCDFGNIKEEQQRQKFCLRGRVLDLFSQSLVQDLSTETLKTGGDSMF